MCVVPQPSLRRRSVVGERVEALLLEEENLSGFLEQPAAEREAKKIFSPADENELATNPHEAAGTMIGPYKLLQLLGEGGMGSVWVAEQSEPVKRRVALKLIKPGMDSSQACADSRPSGSALR